MPLSHTTHCKWVPPSQLLHEALAVKQVQHTLKHAVSTYTHAHTVNRNDEQTQSQSGMDIQTHCALIFPSLNPPHIESYQTIWLVMHVILPSHIVFLGSRHKHNSECSDMHIGTVFSQGRREFIRVQTALIAGDNSYLYVITAC